MGQSTESQSIFNKSLPKSLEELDSDPAQNFPDRLSFHKELVKKEEPDGTEGIQVVAADPVTSEKQLRN